MIIDAPETGDKPPFNMASEKVDDAIVAPAVDDAVANDISMPEIGANKNCGIFKNCRILIVLCCNSDICIIPAIVPVPSNNIHTPCILDNPKAKYSLELFRFPVAIRVTIPPIGRAIIGSITIGDTFPKNNNNIAIIGPHNDLNKLGKSSLCSKISYDSILFPHFINILAKITVVTTPTIAGIILEIITLDRLTEKFPATAIVFGFGDTILPALPPPNMANSIDNLE